MNEPLSPAQARVAWEKFLEFSSGSAELVQSSEILAEWAKSPELHLKEGSKAKYRIEWKERESVANSASQRLRMLRDWQRAELVRLAWRNFALPISAETAGRSWTELAEFTLETELKLAQEKVPEMDRGKSEGFTLLALGKLGAGDLNFYSDLDLIFFHGERDDEGAVTRLARSVVGDLDAPGGERIYRVDLRLRPEGDRGALVPVRSALEDYYEAYGEVWERCAWIRGRRVGGSEEEAYEFFQTLQSFIYPRGISPSALGELFQQKGRAEEELIADADRDREMKRGRGGLREVEFPVLGLQLLHGARQPTLQTYDLRKAIRNLEILRILSPDEAETLRGGYDFWRRLEDFLQMRQIRQTHLLPNTAEEMDVLARAMGKGTGGDLEKEVEGWRLRVRKVYDSIFGELQPKKMSGFDGLSQVKWEDAKGAQLAWKTLEPDEGVHATARTKENFERWQPLLVAELAKCARPDLALAGLSHFVGVYGARSLLYESLCASPKALRLLVKFFESSESMGTSLSARPELFEAVAQAELDAARTTEFHRKALVLPQEEEEAMDLARVYAQGEQLRIALRSLLGLGKIEVFQAEVTALAEICLEWAWRYAGTPKWAWIGLGKLGGSALSFGSDLDLLVVGEGEKEVQKAVHFLTEERASGSLFKVDFRLRPYAEGALAVPVKRYAQYYSKEAQGWELQALCRARVVGGEMEFGSQFWPSVEKSWVAWGKKSKFFSEIREMRERIATERVIKGEEDLHYKTRRGGLMDVEFAAQAWQMRHGLRECRTDEVLRAMAKEFPEASGVLSEGLEFWTKVEWWVRLSEGRGGSCLPQAGRNLEWLAQVMGELDGKSFMEKVRKVYSRVREAYEIVLR
jgi:[glutamine synthetase] adenylyltransferase / [glutamine synthetase]-adenylyl-L-tyrosine phosphorylase